MEMDCKYSQQCFLVFQKLWEHWTSKQILSTWWQNTWVPKQEIFQKQIMLSMVTLKRTIWHLYTSTIHNEDAFSDPNVTLYKWIGTFKWTIQTIILHFQSIKKEENGTYIDDWDVHKSWAILTGLKWCLKEESFNISRFLM